MPARSIGVAGRGWITAFGVVYEAAANEAPVAVFAGVVSAGDASLDGCDRTVT
jgi:hypothetical protein